MGWLSAKTESTRCMLPNAGLNDSFWAEAINYSNTINNCAPTKPLHHSTPYQAWHDTLPDLSQFCVFGCCALSLIQDHNLGKFESRTRDTIYLGPSTDSPAHCFWNPVTKKVITSRSVHFFEARGSVPKYP